jgi:predicted nuclease with TOPRIM domain
MTASLKNKVERLIHHCDTVKRSEEEARERVNTLGAERDQLQHFIQTLQSELERRQSEIVRLTQNMEVLKNAEALSHSDERSSDMKRKINELMREIDNCITLLSK